MAERTCRICGEVIGESTDSPTGSRHTPSRYRCCSVGCLREFWRRKTQAKTGTAAKTSKPCAMCDQPTAPKAGRGRDRKFCSTECRELYRNNASRIAALECGDCGSSFVLRGQQMNRTRCDPCQSDHLARKASSDRSRYRARRRGATVEVFTNYEVFERDGWRCGLCGQRIDRSLSHPHPKSVSIDHVVPLSKGGDHSLANTQASHLGCNMAKSNGVLAPQQLRLVG